MNGTNQIKVSHQRISSDRAVGTLSLGMACFTLAEMSPSFRGTTECLTVEQMLLVTALAALVSNNVTRPFVKRLSPALLLSLLYSTLIVANLLPLLYPTISIILISRILVGFSFGLFFSLAVASIKSTVDSKNEPAVFSNIFFSFFICSAIGIPLYTWLNTTSGVAVIAILPAILNLSLHFLWPLPPITKCDQGNNFKGFLVSQNRKATGLLLLILIPYFAVLFSFRSFILDISVARLNSVVPIILSFGITQFIGILLSRSFLQNNFYSLIVLVPAIIGGLLIGLVFFRNAMWVVYLLVLLAGFLLGVLCIGWSLWFTKGFSISSVEVFFVVIQLAIVLGSCFGMLVNIFKGAAGVILSSAVLLIVVPLWIACLKATKS